MKFLYNKRKFIKYKKILILNININIEYNTEYNTTK